MKYDAILLNSHLNKHLLMWKLFYFIFYFKCILLIILLKLSHIFLPYISLCPVTPSSPAFPAYFMSMDHTYKFFGFSISYTILNLPLSILYLPIMLPITCTVTSFSLLPLPTDNPPCDLHFCDVVPVLVVCLVCFCFFRLGC